MDSVIFVSDERHLDSEIPGGVQLCTQEYIELLRACALRVDILPVSTTRRLGARLKRRLGAVYELYDVNAIAPLVADRVLASEASIVALNQVNFIGLIPAVRRLLEREVQFVILSHGNESGDYLHEIVREPRRGVARLKDIARLGFMLHREATGFSNDVDLVLCMSETERHVDQWLGANRCVVVPRTVEPRFLDWSPVPGRVGFVGTLDHLPNSGGIKRVLDEMAGRPANDNGRIEVRVVGGPSYAGEEICGRYEYVTYLGWLSQEELEAEISTWSLFLNPIWWYARGAATKLAQAIGWGIPIITSVPGRRGYVWDDGAILEVDSPSEMVDVISRVAHDANQLEELARCVRETAIKGPRIADIAEHVRDHLNSRRGLEQPI